MSNETVIWTVGLRCKPEDEQKFNTWYDEVHVPMLLKGGLVKNVARFRLADETYHVGTTTQPSPKYLTIYEFENRQKFESWMTSPARVEAGEDKATTWGDGGYEVVLASRYDRTNAWNG